MRNEFYIEQKIHLASNGVPGGPDNGNENDGEINPLDHLGNDAKVPGGELDADELANLLALPTKEEILEKPKRNC
jgi:hypothetical protein